MTDNKTNTRPYLTASVAKTVKGVNVKSPHTRKALAKFLLGKGQKRLCFAGSWSVPGQQELHNIRLRQIHFCGRGK